MALVWADFPSGSPGLYGTNWPKMLDGRYSLVGNQIFGNDGTVSLVEDPDPNTTGNVIYFPGGYYGGGASRACVRKPLPSGATMKLGMAGRYWLERLPNSTDEVQWPMQWLRNDLYTLGGIRVTPTGTLEAVIDGVLVGGTTGPVVTNGSWWHIESLVTVGAGATSTIKVWVEGALKIDLSGLSFPNIGTGISVAQVCTQPAGTSSAAGMFFKDYVIYDGTGTVNTNQIGTVIVCDLVPDGDVTVGGWTSTAANNWSAVDESNPNDSDYIEAPYPVPAPTVMTLTNLPPDVVAVRGITTVVRALKTDGGDATLQVGLSPNGVAYDEGSVQNPATSSVYLTDVSDLSPVTGVQWTPVEVNALKIKLNRLT